MIKDILYLIGGRSFTNNNLGRKISEVIETLNLVGFRLDTFFGGDLEKTKSLPFSYGAQKYHDSQVSKLKRNDFLKPLIISVSELKDIIHDRKVFSELYKKKGRYKLVWERSSRLHWAGLRYAKRIGVPFVLEWKDHLIDYKWSLFKPLALYIERKKLLEASDIVVESTVLKEELIRNEGIEEDKIHVALNAVNTDEFSARGIDSEIITQYNLPTDKLIVGYIGSYAFYHNTELLVDALSEILKRRTDVFFWLVGNGKDYHLCKDKAKELSIPQENILFSDGVPKEKVPEILRAIDIAVLPGSTDIICPIKIMEYMAAEKAVIAPDYQCNREVIRHGENGVLFEPKSVNSFLNELNWLMGEPVSREKIAKEARVYVATHLSWEQTWGRVARKIVEKYEVGDKSHN
ncbi:glycosyltransferase family 4 protein [Persicobacter diffluens]|uniref:Uncharacterized protein n=1 Tax=Persicobacter diffluens TaxID=981 RepID=A0AAN5AK44_9BACT|nr:hypothetical protein PEDI_20490 [Persicobacter diffluens]